MYLFFDRSALFIMRVVRFCLIMLIKFIYAPFYRKFIQ